MTRSLIDLVKPQAEILNSTLDESIFAANLTEALAGTAPAVYSEPGQFFQRTHPSSGLQELLRMALGRLSGTIPDEAPVLRVDTNLGGGKTHNLIALCHACRGDMPSDMAETFLGTQSTQLLSAVHTMRIGAFVGTDRGVASDESTLWGVLAREIGGAAGYAIIRTDDEARTAPGAAKLKTLLGDQPTLIVIDEIAQYLSKARAVSIGSSTLADQVLAFIMSLCEAVVQLPHTVLVITTTRESQVFREGTEEMMGMFSRLVEITGRQAHIIQASSETDIPGMLTRRLFTAVDNSDVQDIAGAYQDILQQYEHIVGGLPQELSPQRMARRMEATWPFHPELVALLDKRLSTNPYFQRTRGALRLLARTVQLIWKRRDSENPLAIHPHHLDLSDDEIIRPQLTSALQKRPMDQVARADIASRSGESRAGQIDGTEQSYARRAGTVCFLESLTQTASNPTQGTILGSALQPGDDANQMLASWERLRAEAWFLHEERGGFLFKTEPSLAKMILDQTEQVRGSNVLQAALEMLESMFSGNVKTSGGVFQVRRIYANEKVPDTRQEVSLCLFSWSQFAGTQGVQDTSVPPDLVTDLWRRTDTGGLRQFRNRQIFVAPNATHYSAMLDATRRRLALDELAGNASLTASLSQEARTSLKERQATQKLAARVAVANVMNLVWYPQDTESLGLIEMQVGSTARAERNQMDVIYEALADRQKLLASNSPDLDPAILRQQLGQRLQNGYTMREVENFMAQHGACRILLDKQKLRRLIQNGVARQEWEYRQVAHNRWITSSEGLSSDITVQDEDSIHVIGSAPSQIDPNVLSELLESKLQGGCTLREVKQVLSTSEHHEILKDKAKLLQLIRDGVQNNLWECQTGDGGRWITSTDGKLSDITLQDDCILHPAGTKPTSRPDQLVFKAVGNPGTAFDAVVQQALGAQHTAASKLYIEWEAEENAALLCLNRTYQVLAKLRLVSTASIHLNINAESQIGDQNATGCFRGPEALSQTFAEPVKNLLRQGTGSFLDASITIQFQPAASLNGSWQSAVHSTLSETNVSSCSVELVVPEIGLAP